MITPSSYEAVSQDPFVSGPSQADDFKTKILAGVLQGIRVEKRTMEFVGGDSSELGFQSSAGLVFSRLYGL